MIHIGTWLAKTAQESEWKSAEGHEDVELRRFWSAADTPAGVSSSILRFHAPTTPHTHAEFDQLFYVLEGRAIWLLDGQDRQLAEGDALYVEHGVAHGLRTLHGASYSYLVVNIPRLVGPQV